MIRPGNRGAAVDVQSATRKIRIFTTGSQQMDHLSGYAHRPFAFVLRYLRRRLASHLVILTAVVAAVACSVGTQYGVKSLVDSLSAGASHGGSVWLSFIFLMSLIAADNFLWRIASWTASFTFVRVTGDLRRDIFRQDRKSVVFGGSEHDQPGVPGADDDRRPT